MRRRSLTALAIAGLLVAGCGEREETETTATPETPAAESTPAGSATEISTDLETKPAIPKPSGRPPAELVTEDIVEGEGPAAKAGDNVTVRYVGVAHSTGEEFDASWNRNEPFQFQLGAGQVIAGWDQGVAGMKVGGQRRLVIPSSLGYGQRGAGGVIPPGAALVFDVELLDVQGGAS